jgi:hypothetical protein
MRAGQFGHLLAVGRDVNCHWARAGRPQRAYQDALEIVSDDLDDIRIVDAVPYRAVTRWRPPKTH